MRNFVLLVTAVLIAIFAVPPAISVASATPSGLEVAQSPKLYVTVGVDQSGATLFLPATIIIPQVNITLNITFVNNYTVGGGMPHTFSIDNTNAVREISTGNVDPGNNVSIEFHINSLTNITFNGKSFTPESSGQGIRWYCVPHRAAGMVGEILLAGLTAPTPEKGILIRAYWIGIIGIAATLAWTIVSYFIIKSSSGHFKDHHEHIRKGLP
jgi:plastocyanin